MFSPPQSSSRRQLLAAGAEGVAGTDGGADAPSPLDAGTAAPSATRSGLADDAWPWPESRKGSRSSEVGAPARRKGSSDTAASARVAPEAHAPPHTASARSSRRF